MAERIPPPWEAGGTSPAAGCSLAAQSSVRGRPFQPGQSGNPAGRKPGIPDRRNLMAKAFGGEYDAIVSALIEKAKEGDTAAAALYLSRVEPPLRPKAERVTFKLDTTLAVAGQAAQIIQAVADGDLSPDDGQVVMQCLTAYVTLAQADDHEARLRALESKNNREGASTYGAGVVLLKEVSK